MVGDLNSLEDNPEEIFLLLLDGTLIYPFLGFYFVMLILQGILFYVWAGPAALAAKTDPRGGGVAQQLHDDAPGRRHGPVHGARGAQRPRHRGVGRVLVRRLRAARRMRS